MKKLSFYGSDVRSNNTRQNYESTRFHDKYLNFD